MSNVFRSLDTQSDKVSMRQIGIRNLAEREGEFENLSIETIVSERNRLLTSARITIEKEKENIESMRKKVINDIASMQKAWEERKAELERQAYEEGFQSGYNEGREKALSDMADSVKCANEATERSFENGKQYQDSQERVILELAMRSAERIIGETINDDKGKFVSVVKRALKEVREMKEVKLYVSLDYFDLLSSNRSELAAIFPPDVPFLIFVNEEFEATECYIETNHGRIVVSIDEQLNEVREQLIEILESGD